MMKKNDKAIEELLTRGVEEVIVHEHLEQRLCAGEKLRVKLGIDPTGPYLHIGHAVLLRKLKQFQELGHHVVLIIGDFTGRIGDPSGKSEARKILSAEQVKENMKTYLQQIAKILDLKKIEVRYNSEWFDSMSALAFMRLMSLFTAARVLERDDFQKRLKADQDVFVNEIFYPVMQGYDSVMIHADVEIGGNDQKFNMLFGRRVQRQLKKPEQDVMTMKLLVDPTGKKMGKTEGNMITLEDTLEEMYGKVMAWGDGMIVPGFELCTDVPMDEVQVIAQELKNKKINPRDVKMRLAREIVTLYHGAAEARKAEAAFVQTFQKHEMPEDIVELRIKNYELGIVDLLVTAKLVASKGEARRVIEQGGVKVDGKVVDDVNAVIQLSKKGVLIQKGKRHFVRVSS
ncbi:tyrosine--tRNA ligase [Candidatus Uhrbacteria bacterium]|nr:tyrosine--tRNA ligase [Candidatus Uhrbacteria bacterium]